MHLERIHNVYRRETVSATVIQVTIHKKQNGWVSQKAECHRMAGCHRRNGKTFCLSLACGFGFITSGQNLNFMRLSSLSKILGTKTPLATFI